MNTLFTSHRTYILIGGIVCILVVLFFIVYFFFSSEPEEVTVLPQNPVYKNKHAQVEDRVNDLLSYMTLEEKIGQMALVEKGSLLRNEDVQQYALGAILSGSGSKPEQNTFEGWRTLVAELTDFARASRLGIPILYGVDAIHGHSHVPGATVFPHFIGLGASGDEDLVYEVAQATAREVTSTGITWSYSPTLDTPEDIRWGRVYENFSDDPVLIGKLGAAFIRGTHSTQTGSSTKVLATAKHYLGNGGMQWNTSSSKDYVIDQGTTLPDEVRLRSTYLPPFEEAVSAGVQSIMVGLNSWGNTKLAAEHYLLTDVLKNELGFKGFLVSDWYGVYEIPGGEYQAAVTAIRAGVDMVMLPYDYKPFIKNVTRAVRRGDIPLERIDDAVGRILRVKFTLGLFDTVDTPEALTNSELAEHKVLARRAVRESLVLLKNTGGVLPLRDTVSTIRVAGSAGDNIGRQLGAWTVEWQGIDGNWLTGATSLLEGVREVARPGVTVEFSEDASFASGTPKADVGIAFVGEKPYAEGWGDNANPTLHPDDIKTILKLQEVCERVVVVLVTGRPLFITDELGTWDALVVAWLPGGEGAGVADVLFGTYPFVGTLPIPWPSRLEQLPIVAGITKDATPPLFPRYFGLRL